MATRQMTARTVNVLYGWGHPHALEFVGKFSSTIAADYLPVDPGSCVSLNSSGDFVLGCGNADVMPLITFNASDDPCVSNSDGGDPANDKGVYVPFVPEGDCLAFPCSGGFEIVTRQYKAGESYPPNTPLYSTTGDADRGKLQPGTIGTNMIVGLVSRGIVNNGFGHDGLAFWTCPIFPSA